MLKDIKELKKEAENTRRDFIKRFGKYAASAPTGIFLLMSLGTSKAHAGSDITDDTETDTVANSTNEVSSGMGF